jgi:AAA15 family ATPase/GTPase
MKVESINISNYKSIENLILNLTENKDNSYTYSLIGVNEAGKSSILKGIGLFDSPESVKISQKDFLDKVKSIYISLTYIIDDNEIEEIARILSETKDLDVSNEYEVKKIVYKISYIYNDIKIPKIEIFLIENDKEQEVSESHTELINFIKSRLHKIIFWTADEKHLISNPINLQSFANDPSNISIPLRNCFKLEKIENIQEKINLLNDSTEREKLRDILGDTVTKHIKRVWPNHPIQISFDISDGLIYFHVKDENGNGKSKTADQRSDGFKQFISFLLTVSAENMNYDLINTIILLDEPESHLHPTAQEYLLKELTEITKGNNNIVIFATHSNYMIDKNCLSRNWKVSKPVDITQVEKYDDKQSSYASVNYEVFGISSSDYHNELYDKLRELFSDTHSIEDLGILKFDEKYFIQEKNLQKEYNFKQEKNRVTLPTYVRNCTHYPSNKTDKFNDQLEESIKYLDSCLKNKIEKS